MGLLRDDEVGLDLSGGKNSGCKRFVVVVVGSEALFMTLLPYAQCTIPSLCSCRFNTLVFEVSSSIDLDRTADACVMSSISVSGEIVTYD